MLLKHAEKGKKKLRTGIDPDEAALTAQTDLNWYVSIEHIFYNYFFLESRVSQENLVPWAHQAKTEAQGQEDLQAKGARLDIQDFR